MTGAEVEEAVVLVDEADVDVVVDEEEDAVDTITIHPMVVTTVEEILLSSSKALPMIPVAPVARTNSLQPKM
jgi:hypothetical protein